MLSPEQIRKRALNGYEVFLRSLVAGENIFPLPLYGGGLSRVTDYTKARDAIIALREHSKQSKGFGYSVEWKEQNFRRFGEQQVPASVSFPTREDYTRFLGKCSEVCQYEQDSKLVQEAFPELVGWIERNPLKVVEHAGDWTGLLAVCAYLHQHGRPNCYLRELPVEVDTKFIERKRGVLCEILPIVSPGCVGDDASTFETRFGFRQKQPLIRFRCLDSKIVSAAHLPFSDFAVPLEVAQRLAPPTANVIIVENEMTFLTLPALPQTVAIYGGGDAVTHLCKLAWLAHHRLAYWGDLDAHGFESLSLLRSQHSHAQSMMMDVETFTAFKQFAVAASAYNSRATLHLNDAERDLFNLLARDGKLLEQERIPLAYATNCLMRCLA